MFEPTLLKPDVKKKKKYSQERLSRFFAFDTLYSISFNPFGFSDFKRQIELNLLGWLVSFLFYDHFTAEMLKA